MIILIIVIICLIVGFVGIILNCKDIWGGIDFFIGMFTSSIVLLILLGMVSVDADKNYIQSQQEFKEERAVIVLKLQNPDKFDINDIVEEVLEFNEKYDRIVSRSSNPWYNIFYNIKDLEGVEKIDLTEELYEK